MSRGRMVSVRTPPVQVQGRALPPGLPWTRPVPGMDVLSLRCSASSVLGHLLGNAEVPDLPANPSENVSWRKVFSSPSHICPLHPHCLLPRRETQMYQTFRPEGAVVSASLLLGGVSHLASGCLCPVALLLTGGDSAFPDSSSCSHRHCDLIWECGGAFPTVWLAPRKVPGLQLSSGASPLLY